MNERQLTAEYFHTYMLREEEPSCQKNNTLMLPDLDTHMELIKGEFPQNNVGLIVYQKGLNI